MAPQHTHPSARAEVVGHENPSRPHRRVFEQRPSGERHKRLDDLGVSGVVEWHLYDYDDHRYTVTDFRANHAIVGLRWEW